MYSDFFFGVPPLRTDRHRLAGKVYVDEVLGRGLVVLRDRNSQALVAAKLSDAVTGAFEFYGLPQYPEESLIIELMDNTGTYNADVADYLTQVTW